VLQEGDKNRILLETADAKIQDMKDALITKRESLLSELKELDNRASLLQQEYSAKLEELQAKRKPLEEALPHIEALLRYEEYYINANQSNDSTSSVAGVATEISLTDAAFDLLQEIHQPLHYKDITLKLQERNVYIPGKNPAATLLSRVNRDKRFKRATSRGVYGLSTWRMRTAKRKRAKTHKARRR